MRELFEAADGLRFVHQERVLVLRGGLYGNGRGALTVEEGSGAKYAQLTVNLPEVELAPDELLVRNTEGIAALHAGVLRTGLFEGSRCDPVPAGYVRDYALAWRFARHGGRHAALCADCRAAADLRFQADLEALRAEQTRRRLVLGVHL